MTDFEKEFDDKLAEIKRYLDGLGLFELAAALFFMAERWKS